MWHALCDDTAAHVLLFVDDLMPLATVNRYCKTAVWRHVQEKYEEQLSALLAAMRIHNASCTRRRKWLFQLAAADCRYGSLPLEFRMRCAMCGRATSGILTCRCSDRRTAAANLLAQFYVRFYVVVVMLMWMCVYCTDI